MFNYRIATVVACLNLLALVGVATAQEEAVEVYDRVQGAVVLLESLDSTGTGMILNDDGLILTNAHVMASPMRFRCIVEVKDGDDYETVTFHDVEVVGFHPTLDMALVQIDPSEHEGELVSVELDPRAARPGQRVYAIGNPSGGGVSLNKTITQGILSGVDREVDGDEYYQIDAAINPGNSGGPLCDRDGEVIGMVTLKFTDADNIGFAIPLDDLDLDDFAPLAEREVDLPRARELIAEGDKWYDRAGEAAHRGEHDEESEACYVIALVHYHMAITFNPKDSIQYYNVGMLLRSLGEYEVASAYLAEAVRIEPWGHGDFIGYRELGLSLAYQERTDEALLAWQEGVAKYPSDASKIWEDLAVCHGMRGEAYEAAFAAGVVLALDRDDSRLDVAQAIYDHNTNLMEDDALERLKEELDDIEGTLDRRKTFAQRQHRQGTDWINNEFQTYIYESR